MIKSAVSSQENKKIIMPILTVCHFFLEMKVQLTWKMVKRCSYGICNTDSRYLHKVWATNNFIHSPNLPKTWRGVWKGYACVDHFKHKLNWFWFIMRSHAVQTTQKVGSFVFFEMPAFVCLWMMCWGINEKHKKYFSEMNWMIHFAEWALNVWVSKMIQTPK